MSMNYQTKMTTIPHTGPESSITFENPDRVGVQRLIEMFKGEYVVKNNGVVHIDEPDRVEIEVSDARIRFEVTPPTASV